MPEGKELERSSIDAPCTPADTSPTPTVFEAAQRGEEWQLKRLIE